MDKDWLIKGGQLLPIANGPESIAGDILVKDGRIVAIERDIDAEVPTIDAAGCIVLPGFVDTHRHLWQTQLRTLCTDWSLWDYITLVRRNYATLYTAEDVYLGNHVGVLEGLDAGVTTVVDHSHIANSPDHAEAALRGIVDGRTRAVFCYCTFHNEQSLPFDPPLDPDWREQTARKISGNLAGNGLVRFGFAPSEAEAMTYEELVREIRLARELGANTISCHIRLGHYDFGLPIVEQLCADGLMGPDLLFVHGAAFSDRELDIIRDSGAAIAATPETELQMGMGFPVAHRAREHGINTGLGIDIVSNYAGDMFLPMRLGLQATRAVRNAEIGAQSQKPLKITPDAFSVLRMATLGGAECLGMESEIGSLEVGKRADITIIRTDAIHMTPVHDPVGAVVLYARPGDVDTVLVDGVAVKRNGHLTNVDWDDLRNRIRQSAERIREEFLAIDPVKFQETLKPPTRGAGHRS